MYLNEVARERELSEIPKQLSAPNVATVDFTRDASLRLKPCSSIFQFHHSFN